MDDFVQCWSNSRVEDLKVWTWKSFYRTQKFQIIHWFNHLHFFDPQHSFPYEIVSKYIPQFGVLSSNKQMFLVYGICQSEFSRSAVFVGLLHNSLKILPHKGWLSFWLRVLTGISNAWTGVWLSLITCGDVFCDTIEPQGLDSCGWGAEEDAVGFAKTFPDIPCVSQILGGPFLRLGIPRERLSIPPGLWKKWEKRWLTGNVGLSTAY